MPSLLAVAAVVALWPGPARAHSKTMEITVAAGKHDRVQTPVRVPVTLPADLLKVETVSLRDPAGNEIIGQFTHPGLLSTAKGEGARELHFILPRLKAGDTLTLKADLGGKVSPPAEVFSWHDTPGEYTELRWGKQPVLRYVYKAIDESTDATREQTFKVFHHLFDPEGKRLVTNGPGGLYPHHRGLFYGFMKVSYGDGKLVDTWHCKRDAKKGIDAYESHEKFVSSEAGPVLGRHLVEVGWHGTGKDIFAREERELTVYRVPGGQLVEFASRLKSEGGPVKLDGDPQHAGFHFRADNEVNEKAKNETYFLRPDGPGEKGKERNWPDVKTHVNLPWDALSFVLGGRRYTLAYLDRPSNPKEARFSERTYGRIGSYFVAEFDEKKPLDVNYRVWLQEGEMTGAQVEAKSEDFVSPVTVTVK
jgi:hypothetical protein